MSSNNYISEKQQYSMESEKKELNNDIESQTLEQPSTSSSPPRPAFVILWLLFVLGTMCTIIASNWNCPEAAIHATQHHQKPSTPPTTTSSPLPSSAPTSTCKDMVIRREWRTFSEVEKARYQSSVRCLMERPSKSGSGSRYTDFLHAYESAGWHATRTSDYLPWNRWYLHSFETAMRRECAYTGDMAYLDWTQAVRDSEDEPKDIVAASDSSSPQSTLRSSKAIEQPLDASIISEILSSSDYLGFIRNLESRIQDLAPFDFSNSDLAQDPLFLHQSQVDRLWWLWQQHHADAETVVDMSTENDDLCYR